MPDQNEQEPPFEPVSPEGVSEDDVVMTNDELPGTDAAPKAAESEPTPPPTPASPAPATMEPQIPEVKVKPEDADPFKALANIRGADTAAPEVTQPKIVEGKDTLLDGKAARDKKKSDEPTPTPPVLDPQKRAMDKVRQAQAMLAEQEAQKALLHSTDELKCPQCGSTNFKIEDGLIQWCGNCGCTALNWAYRTPELTEKAKKYVLARGGGVAGKVVHKDTPQCGAPTRAIGGRILSCTSREYVHDGKKLLRCSKCGANFTTPKNKRAQPANIAEIIKHMGPAETSGTEVPGVTRMVTTEGARRVRRAQGRKADPATDRAYVG